MNAFGSVLPIGFETRMIYSPQLITATKQLRSIPLPKRQCLFTGEKHLRFYQTYTEQNCAQECESNGTLELCNCVIYYMPSEYSFKEFQNPGSVSLGSYLSGCEYFSTSSDLALEMWNSFRWYSLSTSHHPLLCLQFVIKQKPQLKRL